MQSKNDSTLEIDVKNLSVWSLQSQLLQLFDKSLDKSVRTKMKNFAILPLGKILPTINGNPH